MLRFEGDRDFPRTPAEVWAKLSDARFLVSCIPDVESVQEQEADRARLVLRPGFSFVRGTLEVVLQVHDAVAPTTARLVLHSKGIGATADIEASLHLSPHPDGPGTHVHWVAEVKELGGLLKMVPAGLIRGAAQKVIDDAWKAVDARLGP